jgi:hypothetical protein
MGAFLKNKMILNKKGISPTITVMVLLVVTVFTMSTAIFFISHLVQEYQAQMGEKLYVERFTVNETSVNLYVRNIGHFDITLEFYNINGTRYPFTSTIIIPAPAANPYEKETLISVPKLDSEDVIYLLSFFSSKHNELGNVEVNLI